MYRKPGVRSDTWLTEREETYRLAKGIGNYGLWPVDEVYTNKDWERIKKEIGNYLKNDLKRTGEDFQKIWKSTKTASRNARKYLLKQAGKHPGYVAGLALGALGVIAKCSGTEWLDGIGEELIGSGLVPVITEFVTRKIRKMERNILKTEYFELMKELMKSDFQPDEKIYARYIMGVDKFTPKLLGKNGYKTEELEGELENMKTVLERLKKMKENKQTGRANELPKAA